MNQQQELARKEGENERYPTSLTHSYIRNIFFFCSNKHHYPCLFHHNYLKLHQITNLTFEKITVRNYCYSGFKKQKQSYLKNTLAVINNIIITSSLIGESHTLTTFMF
jgi:hypothetical protein